MFDTRDPKAMKHEDPRKSISEAPSFEEYLRSRQAAAGGGAAPAPAAAAPSWSAPPAPAPAAPQWGPPATPAWTPPATAAAPAWPSYAPAPAPATPSWSAPAAPSWSAPAAPSWGAPAAAAPAAGHAPAKYVSLLLAMKMMMRSDWKEFCPLTPICSRRYFYGSSPIETGAPVACLIPATRPPRSTKIPANPSTKPRPLKNTCDRVRSRCVCIR